MELTENFALHEFACNDKKNTPVPCELLPNVTRLADQLQVLRDHLGISIHVNSGYRTKAYNTSVGGSPKSQHLEAKAADITTTKHTPKQLAAIVKKLIREGKMLQGGVGIYPSFVHYDIRGTEARW
jgi:uncharacterized protein YcbK (DUF882 family)